MLYYALRHFVDSVWTKTLTLVCKCFTLNCSTSSYCPVLYAVICNHKTSRFISTFEFSPFCVKLVAFFIFHCYVWTWNVSTLLFRTLEIYFFIRKNKSFVQSKKWPFWKIMKRRLVVQNLKMAWSKRFIPKLFVWHCSRDIVRMKWRYNRTGLYTEKKRSHWLKQWPIRKGLGDKKRRVVIGWNFRRNFDEVRITFRRSFNQWQLAFSYLLNPFLLATALTNEISSFLYIIQFGCISTSFWRCPLKSVRRKALGWNSYFRQNYERMIAHYVLIHSPSLCCSIWKYFSHILRATLKLCNMNLKSAINIRIKSNKIINFWQPITQINSNYIKAHESWIATHFSFYVPDSESWQTIPYATQVLWSKRRKRLE